MKSPALGSLPNQANPCGFTSAALEIGRAFELIRAPGRKTAAVVANEAGCELITRDVPVRVDEIEALMRD